MRRSVPQGTQNRQLFGPPSGSCSMQTPIDDVTGVEGGIAGFIAWHKLLDGVVSMPFPWNGEPSPGSDHNDKLGP
jgi:hypothetical protein